jgi:hypothetical protein
LLDNVEALLHGEGEEFVKSSKVGSLVLIAQRCTNHHGQYLALVEYEGGDWRAFIIIPKRSEGKGWRSCCLDLQKEHSFQLSLGDGIRVLSSRRLLGSLPLSGVGGSTSAIEIWPQQRLLEKGRMQRSWKAWDSLW